MNSIKSRRKQRLLNFIRDYLNTHGEASTGELLDNYNEYSYHGACINEISNVLAKCGFVEKIGMRDVKLIVNSSEQALWSLVQDVV